MNVNIAILAAGRGTRMHSQLPKVLHPVAGKPMLQWLIETATALQPQNTYVVCGYQKEKIQQAFAQAPVTWLEQTKQLGTADAVNCVLPHVPSDSHLLVLVGDTPLISVQTLQKFIAQIETDALGLLTSTVSNPAGLGRILRDQTNQVMGIVEEKDADEQQKAIGEINTGIMLLPVNDLQRWLANITANNTQQELYLTDVVAMAAQEQKKICTLYVAEQEVLSVNNRVQLAYLERYQQRRIAENLMLQGVTLFDPNRLDIRGDVDIASDVTLDINVVMTGKVSIGRNSIIGANVVLRNTTIGENVTIKSHSDIEGATIANHCEIGPFARIRAETVLAEHVKIGNFVEIKKTTIAANSKANHLTYLGDATIGKGVNIGAGTITCNYDGVNKASTIIEDGVFIGSNSALIAPITIGKNATIAAGSIINKSAPAEQLTLSRVKQTSMANWRRPQKKS
ncbi:MAG: bifunctional UDP-N-acetylglucosamine diphosphorylase/glucosamine-1-phosphate N-acetyltransferase GlmU [Gammaproteobacteria bacterium]|nr:bifunctional UDP-N-acetylglucosamine diphosphorylase/glucosamine-1-phosphate N-acetyltransferase GlmU [Gammaproteobacteria bacterium]